jgi:thioredoxin-related protein
LLVPSQGLAGCYAKNKGILHGHDHRKGKESMADDIDWEISLKNALNLSRKENKLVLVAFFGATCEACIKMKNCTLMTEGVQDYIKMNFIPEQNQARPNNL